MAAVPVAQQSSREEKLKGYNLEYHHELEPSGPTKPMPHIMPPFIRSCMAATPLIPR